MIKNSWILLLVAFIQYGCIETTTSRGSAYIPAEASPAVNESGNKTREDVIQNTLTQREKQRRERNLETSRLNYEEDPDDETNIIWYGRRLAYLGKYEESINIYTVGESKFPSSYKILRHRGHRYITLREFDKAVDDLQTAAFYVRNEPIEIEPDGIPNAYNRPLSNNKFNIWYHLGLAYYLKGNYDKAISSYKKCLEYSNNNDLKVATSYWLYNTYLKIGNTEAANELIRDINGSMRLIENKTYHELIMMFKGFLTPESLVTKYTSDGVLNATAGYGIGNYFLANNKKDRAIPIFSRIIETDQWDSFGYIASEVELSNFANNPL
jgi:tetratricopeptide (TPR) repeat protein